MKRKSWKRTERDGMRPVPDSVPGYREWCDNNGLDPETAHAWERWTKKFGIESYLP